MPDPSPQRLEFDAKAEVYESNRLAPWYRAQGDQVLEHLSLQPADLVLDVGCGTGYLLRQIARSCPGVTGIGVDIAPKRLSLSPDASEPFRTPVSALRTIHDVLCPGGQLLILNRARAVLVPHGLLVVCASLPAARPRTLQQLGRDRQHARAGGISDVRVLAQLRRALCKKKRYSSPSVIGGTRSSVQPVRTA